MSVETLKSYFDPLGPIWSLVGLLLFGIAVWYFSHRNAKPDTTVSILWGLTSYTRRDSAANPDLSILSTSSPSLIGDASKVSEFADNSVLPLVFDRERSNAEAYLILSELWIKSFEHFLNHSSPVLRRILISAIAGKRAVLTVTVDRVRDQEDPPFVICSIGRANLCISLRSEFRDALARMEKGQTVTLDSRVSNSEHFLFDDGVIVDLQPKSRA